MSKVTAVSATDDLAAMRRRREEIHDQVEQLKVNKLALLRRLHAGADDAAIQELARAIIAGEDISSTDLVQVELAKTEERIAGTARALDVLDEAIARAEYREAIETRLRPAFAAAHAHIARLEAALRGVETVLQAADDDHFEFLQQASRWAHYSVRFPDVALGFDERELSLLLAWRSDFLPFDAPVNPATSDEKIAEQLFLEPTRLERWREDAAELGVKLAHPALWIDRAKGYVRKRKAKGGPNVWVRLTATLADAIGTGKPGTILKVSSDQAADLVDGRFAEVVSEEDVIERIEKFGSAREDENSEAAALADPKGDAPVKEHLVAAAAATDDGDDPAAWTPRV
jgi:hypothetical protein